MRRVELYGKRLELQGSPYTFLVYRNAFKGDLLRDLTEAYGGETPALSILLQVCWAMAKTHDDEVLGYGEWLRSFDPKDFALGESEAWGVIDSAISAELFRREKAGRVRRWLSRRMDALAQRVGAAAARLHA